MDQGITEEDLRNELENMGYSGIPNDLFMQFKRDLDRLISEDQLHSVESILDTPQLNGSETQALNTYKNSSYLNEFHLNLDVNPKIQDHKGSAQPILTETLSNTSNRVIKRKTLKHHSNGKPFIEESSFTSTISDDGGHLLEQNLGKKYNKPLYDKRKSRSTGNLFDNSKKKLPTVLPMVAYGSKQCDPVSRYHQYRKYWESHKTPCEKGHKNLRWNIREQMLDYDPIAEFSLKQMPNIFHIPKERRSNLYKWNSCSNLNDRFS